MWLSRRLWSDQEGSYTHRTNWLQTPYRYSVLDFQQASLSRRSKLPTPGRIFSANSYLTNAFPSTILNQHNLRPSHIWQARTFPHYPSFLPCPHSEPFSWGQVRGIYLPWTCLVRADVCAPIAVALSPAWTGYCPNTLNRECDLLSRPQSIPRSSEKLYWGRILVQWAWLCYWRMGRPHTILRCDVSRDMTRAYRVGQS